MAFVHQLVLHSNEADVIDIERLGSVDIGDSTVPSSSLMACVARAFSVIGPSSAGAAMASPEPRQP